MGNVDCELHNSLAALAIQRDNLHGVASHRYWRILKGCRKHCFAGESPGIIGSDIGQLSRALTLCQQIELCA